MAKSSRRQYLVSVSGIDGYFMTKAGGNVTAATSKAYDGGVEEPDIMAGLPEAANVTVTRVFDVDRDGALLKKLRSMVGVFTATVSSQPTDRNLVAVGDPTVYPNALLVGLNEPDYDASASDPSTFELEFAIGAFH